VIKTVYLNPVYTAVLAGYGVEYKKLFDRDYVGKALTGSDIDIIASESARVCRSPDLFLGPLEKFVSAYQDIPTQDFGTSNGESNDGVVDPIDTNNLCAIAVDKDAVILYAGQKESLTKGSTVENVLTAMASVMPLETLLQTPLYRAYVRLDT